MTEKTIPLNDQWALLLGEIGKMIPAYLAEESRSFISLTITRDSDGRLQGTAKTCDPAGASLNDLRFTVGHVVVKT